MASLAISLSCLCLYQMNVTQAPPPFFFQLYVLPIVIHLLDDAEGDGGENGGESPCYTFRQLVAD